MHFPLFAPDSFRSLHRDALCSSAAAAAVAGLLSLPPFLPSSVSAEAELFLLRLLLPPRGEARRPFSHSIPNFQALACFHFLKKQTFMTTVMGILTI